MGIVKFAGAAACCLVLASPLASAGELRLSDEVLDTVTAGRLFQPSVGGGLLSQAQPGVLNPAPPPPAPAPSPSPSPTPNSISVSEGGTTATIFTPTAPEGASVSGILNVLNDGGLSQAVAGLSIVAQGGGNISSNGVTASASF